MIIKFTPPNKALVAAGTHADYPGLEPVTVDGPYIVFAFGDNATLESATEELDKIEAAVVALAIEEGQSAELAAYLAQVQRARKEVEREYAYIMNASANAEPVASEQESQLHADTHAASNDSASSNEADLQTTEELSDNGQATESTSTRRKRG